MSTASKFAQTFGIKIQTRLSYDELDSILAQYCRGAYRIHLGGLETTLKRGELITRIDVPALNGRRAAYLKCTTRSADDWPALGMAVVLDAQKREASIVVSAATDRPTRLSMVEKLFSGKEISENLLNQAAEAARSIDIEGDLHGSAAYKKHLIGVYLKRAVHEARNASH